MLLQNVLWVKLSLGIVAISLILVHHILLEIGPRLRLRCCHEHITANSAFSITFMDSSHFPLSSHIITHDNPSSKIMRVESAVSLISLINHTNVANS
jgi:hypothetical protein